MLKLLRFVPDKPMVKLQYRIKTGRRLNLKNPQRFTEKLQWYKLYYRNPVMQQCVNKYAVRDYIRQKGLEERLPWNHLDAGVSKEFLLREWAKAQRAELTHDCRKGCVGCGVKRYEGACV